MFSMTIPLESQTLNVIPLPRMRADRPTDGHDQQASQKASPQTARQGSGRGDRGGYPCPRRKGARETGSDDGPVGEQPRQLPGRCTSRMVRNSCRAHVRRRTTTTTTIYGDQWGQEACRGGLNETRWVSQQAA